MKDHSTPVEGTYTSIRRAASPEVLSVAGVQIPLADMIAFTFPDEPTPQADEPTP